MSGIAGRHGSDPESFLGECPMEGTAGESRIPGGRRAVLVGQGLFLLAAGLGFGLLFARPAAADGLLDVQARILQLEDRRESNDELRNLLHDDRAEIRGRAALAIGRIGSPADVASLAPLLHDDDADVRAWTAFALGEIEDSTAAVPLESLLLDREEPAAEVRALAVEGLGKLRRGPEACKVALRDRDENVQVQALLAAWKIPVSGIVPELVQMARHEHDQIREWTAYCLMRMLGAPASGRTPIPGGLDLSAEDREQIQQTLRHLATDPSPQVRMQAARGLRNVGGAETTNVLLTRLEDDDWRVRVEALRSLGAQIPESLGGPRAVPLPPLFARIDDDNPNVGITAIEALTHAQGVRPGDPLLVDARLRRLLAHDTPRFRESAFRALASRWHDVEMGDPERARLQAQLDTVLTDRHWTVRAAALDALDLLSQDDRAHLLDRLRDDDGRVAKLALSPYFRMRAEDATGPILDRLQPELDRMLDSSDAILRYSAWDAVRELYDPGEDAAPIAEEDWTRLEALLAREHAKLAEDPAFVEVRQEMIVLAALQPTRPALGAFLKASCADPNYLVRRDAVAALRAAGETPPREAEPIETGRTLDDYRQVLEWAARDWRAEIETDGGTLTVRLFTQDAPLTCWNFAHLCDQSFYDGGNWHRVVPDFVLQDGCPRGDGWGGPPWQIRCEINRHRY
ncbi:MAG: HEAT repeat domain-containing protein, partial [Candidatus Eisenbacteria bacterium]|nr:HEAT repeat domain-containing protein [Candidatus Eisenbacteria bacterium]